MQCQVGPNYSASQARLQITRTYSILTEDGSRSWQWWALSCSSRWFHWICQTMLRLWSFSQFFSAAAKQRRCAELTARENVLLSTLLLFTGLRIKTTRMDHQILPCSSNGYGYVYEYFFALTWNSTVSQSSADTRLFNGNQKIPVFNNSWISS